MIRRKDQLECGRKNGGRNNDTLRRHSSICCLCMACCVSSLLLVSVDFHSLMQVDFLFKKKINVVVPGCMKLCNFDLEKFSKSQGGDDFLNFLANNEKFMYYAPHSGFNNQVVEFNNALLVAKILNRTLVVPPVLDHHATRLGSCPKRRVLRPYSLRAHVWMKIFDLISNSRYTSIADIVNISSITPSKVKTIDLRVFLALWCGVDISASCGGTLCKTFARKVFSWNDYETCVQTLNPMPLAESKCCVYGVENDCTSTIWVYNPKLRNNETAELQKDNLQSRSLFINSANLIEPHELLNVRSQSLKKISNQHWKAEKVEMAKIEVTDILSSLGANSVASMSSVIAFGSMFSMMYKDAQSHINITIPSGDKDLDDLIHSLKLLSFSSEIIAAGKTFIDKEIAKPEYFCAQIRLSDGQFKNHRNATIENLKAHLTSLRSSWSKMNPIPIFVMTDLPNENWTKALLKDFLLDSRNPYQMYKLLSRNDLIESASMRILTAEDGFAVGSITSSVRGFQKHQEQLPMHAKFRIPHVELAIEEVVCSCARLGFSGTQGSTIADSIRDLRTIVICNTSSQSSRFET